MLICLLQVSRHTDLSTEEGEDLSTEALCNLIQVCTILEFVQVILALVHGTDTLQHIFKANASSDLYLQI